MSSARNVLNFAAEGPWFSSAASCLFLWRMGKNKKRQMMQLWSFSVRAAGLLWQCETPELYNITLRCEFYFPSGLKKKYISCVATGLHLLSSLPKSRRLHKNKMREYNYNSMLSKIISWSESSSLCLGQQCISITQNEIWVYFSSSEPQPRGSPLLTSAEIWAQLLPAHGPSTIVRNRPYNGSGVEPKQTLTG